MNKIQYMAMSLPYGLKVASSKEVVTMHFANFHYCIIASTDNLFKPVLRPLSDLNEEMKDGRTFLQYFECMFDFESDTICPIRMYINSGWTTKINELPFEIVIKLIEWHFDICGLIEKGEAVDYHELSGFVF